MKVTIDIQDDPYGDALRGMKDLIAIALTEPHVGLMNDAEHANLIAIEEFLRMRDNA